MFGFQAVNENNIIQLDSDFINFSVISRGTTSGSGISTFDVQPADILLIRPPNNTFGTKLSIIDQSESNKEKMSWVPTSPASIKYVKLSPANVHNSTNEKYGLQIFSESGGLGFDSRQVQATLVSVTRVTPTANGGNIQLPALPVGFTYYFSANSVAVTHFRNLPTANKHRTVEVLEVGFTSDNIIRWRVSAYTETGFGSFGGVKREGEFTVCVFKVAN